MQATYSTFVFESLNFPSHFQKIMGLGLWMVHIGYRLIYSLTDYYFKTLNYVLINYLVAGYPIMFCAR